MNGKFHTAVGVAASVLICRATNIEVSGIINSMIRMGVETGININNVGSYADILLISSFASTAPDLDLKIPFMKHRTWTHSLLVFILSTIALSFLGNNIYIVWAISYLAHLIADSFTSMGVPFLYPFIKEKYGLKIL